MEEGNNIPERFLSYLPQIMQEGILGLYELNMPEGVLTFFGRSLVESLLGVDADRYSIDWNEYVETRCHPDSRKDMRKHGERVAASPEGYSIRYRVLNEATEEWRWLYASGVVAPKGKHSHVIYGSVLDVTASVTELQEAEERIQKAQNEVRVKNRLLQSVNDIANDLLTVNQRGFENVIHHSLSSMGRSVGADRVYIWENFEQDNKLFCRQIYEWVEGTEPQQGKNFAISTDYDDVPYWKAMILSGNSINGPVKNLPAEERAVLEPQRICSVLVIPIINEGAVIGFIGFDDCRTERYYSVVEEQVLQSGGALIVSAVLRNRMTEQLVDANQELVRHRKLLFAVSDVAELILENEQKKFGQTIQKSLQVLGESVKAHHVSIWRNFYGDDKKLCSTCLSIWMEGQSQQMKEKEPCIDFERYIPKWNEGVIHRADIDMPIEDAWEPLRSFHILQKSTSLLLIPLHIQGEFWGFVGFSHGDVQRRFSLEERNIVRSGSMMIASAIARNEIKKVLVDAEKRAITDNLTGMENRNGFCEKAEEVFAHQIAEQKTVTILFFDLDHFKNINDNYGHPFGDEVLKSFANLIKSTTRPQDLACRYGGEEFVMMLSNIDEQGATKIGERIMEKMKYISFDGKPEFSLTTSIGLMSGVPQTGETLNQYIQNADLALYKAKENGRNRIVSFQANMTKHMACE